MKAIHIFPVTLTLLIAGSEPSGAAMAVTDFTLIRTNLVNARQALAEQVLHGTRQVEQIRNIVRQIEQLDTYIGRFGDPSKVTPETFADAVELLGSLGLNLSAGEITEDMDPREIFRGGVGYAAVSQDIEVGDETIGRIDAEAFAPEVAARRILDHYHRVRDAALAERERVRTALAQTLRELRAAPTASEVAKLDALARSLESQLAAADREIELAASELLARWIGDAVEERVQSKVRVQKQRAFVREGTERDLELYRLPTRLLYFKR